MHERPPARTRLLLLGLTVVLGVGLTGLAPASAHSCAEAITVVEGQETEVQVGITVGEAPTDDIAFEFPDTIEIVEVVERRGWTGEQQGPFVRFSEGHLDIESCDVFDIVIRATEAGTFRVPAYQQLADGQIVQHPPDGDIILKPDGTSVVVDHQGPPNTDFEQIISVTEAAEESSARTILLIATAAALLVVAAVTVWRRLRRRPPTVAVADDAT